MSVADAPESIPLNVPLIVPGAVCRDFERASRLEWLDTNHTGAFAMGTVAGVNTRRYHGLLTASLKPPANRYSILPRVEEVVSGDQTDFLLGASQYPGAVYPRGFELLNEFRIDPFPEWRYNCGGASVVKTLCLVDRQQTVIVRYRSSRPCILKIRLLTSFRDYHSLAHRNDELQNKLEIAPGRISFTPYESLPSLSVLHCGEFTQDGEWFLRHQYLRELDRGLDSEEDLFSPGVIKFELAADGHAWFLATLEPSSPLQDRDIDSLLEGERTRRQFDGESQLESTLKRALDQFRITRYDEKPSLIAGYPWFTDWSRDTLISLPALSAAEFALSETKSILEMLIGERSEGLLPNRFLDSHSEPEYNTADATLCLFIAAKHYIDRTQDRSFLKNCLYPAARDILDWHRRGTKYGIHVDPADHLLWAGEAAPQLSGTQLTGTQLTWMDARVNGSAVTPRVGKPVEINALWYNALRIFAEWSIALGMHKEAEQLQLEAAAMLHSFRGVFWNDERQCLFDVVAGQSRDPRVRPNQLFALSLPYPLVELHAGRLIVKLVQEKLLTPVGLRTLEPGDSAYRPRFEGSMADRDTSYHQGTVWPWLMGPFIGAYLYAYGETEGAIRFCRGLLNGLAQDLTSCCLGSLTEVYDAEPPYNPGGCPAQLWSVAQLLMSMRRLQVLDSRSHATR